MESELHLDWIRRVASGDRASFEKLYHAYYKRVFGYVFRMLDDAELAEETVNDVMVEIWKSASKFRGEAGVSTWIFGIARHRALSSLRRSGPANVELEHAESIADPVETADERLIRTSTRERIKSAIAKLSVLHREVIDLTFYQEFSYIEIAEILGCPVGTVKTRMFHARKQLEELLGLEA